MKASSGDGFDRILRGECKTVAAMLAMLFGDAGFFFCFGAAAAVRWAGLLLLPALCGGELAGLDGGDVFAALQPRFFFLALAPVPFGLAFVFLAPAAPVATGDVDGVLVGEPELSLLLLSGAGESSPCGCLVPLGCLDRSWRTSGGKGRA